MTSRWILNHEQVEQWKSNPAHRAEEIAKQRLVFAGPLVTHDGLVVEGLDRVVYYTLPPSPQIQPDLAWWNGRARELERHVELIVEFLRSVVNEMSCAELADELERVLYFGEKP